MATSKRKRGSSRATWADSQPPPKTEPPVSRPLVADHPLIRDAALCPGCGKRFQAGEQVTIVRVGPGADPEQRRRARTGLVYLAVGLPAHQACVTGGLT